MKNITRVLRVLEYSADSIEAINYILEHNPETNPINGSMGGGAVALIGWDKEPKVALACGYRNKEEQIRLVNEIEYNSPHKFNWHTYARECGISKISKFKSMTIRRKR